MSDRQHPRVPDPPESPAAFCDLLEDECRWWLDAMTNTPPGRMNDRIPMFGGDALTVRCYLGHMLQNVIYKNGKVSFPYFGLELEEPGPYVPPMPNASYDALAAGEPLP